MPTRPRPKRVDLLFLFIGLLLFTSLALADDKSSAPASEIYNKALRYYEKKNWNVARELLHQYLAEYSDTPLYVTCLYYLAFCYQELNQKEQAILLYHKVIDGARGDDAFWGLMAQKRLDELVDQ